MDVGFDSAALAHTCANDRERTLAYGSRSAELIRRRLGQLCAAKNLSKLREFTAVQLRPGILGQDAVVFIAAGPEINLAVRAAGDGASLTDEAAVTSVVVVGLVPAGSECPDRHPEASTLNHEGSL